MVRCRSLPYIVSKTTTIPTAAIEGSRGSEDAIRIRQRRQRVLRPYPIDLIVIPRHQYARHRPPRHGLEHGIQAVDADEASMVPEVAEE